MTTLEQLGYNEFGMKPLIGEVKNAISTSNIRSVSASKIVGGRLSSVDGKTYLDLDSLKRLVINDGDTDRVIVGRLD